MPNATFYYPLVVVEGICSLLTFPVPNYALLLRTKFWFLFIIGHRDTLATKDTR
jgi:hypothetical protein